MFPSAVASKTRLLVLLLGNRNLHQLQSIRTACRAPARVSISRTMNSSTTEGNSTSSRKRGPSEGENNEDDDNGKIFASSTSQEPQQPGKGSPRQSRSWIKTKKARSKKGETWMKDFSNNNNRDDPPHVGSFANPAMREQFNVVLEEGSHQEIMEEGAENANDSDTVKRKVAILVGFLGTKYGKQLIAPSKILYCFRLQVLSFSTTS